MSVVRRDTARRWSLVAAGVAVLCLLPAVIAAWPSPRVAVEPGRLRESILASTDRPYTGYVDSRGDVRLPNLPALGEVAGLLGASTRVRAWYAAPTRWRVAVLSPTGERDIYGTATGTYVWDFERNLTTLTVGDAPVRLPWAADLLPPDLARRLLSMSSAGDPIAPLPGRTVAGVAAAGLRLTPSDPDTTVGHIDVWADPVTGLPVQVELSSRDRDTPIYVSRFLDLAQTAPPDGVLTPSTPDTGGLTVTTAADIAAAVGGLAPVNLPARVAGRARVANPAGLRVPGVAAYGTGLSAFVVLAVPGRVGGQTLRSARDAGATPVAFTAGEGYETRTSLLAALVARTGGDRQSRRTFLVVGAVTPDLLRRAATELLALPRTVP